MTAWNPEANSLFIKAAEIESEVERVVFLDLECAGNMALRSEVEALLASARAAENFLNEPAIVIIPTFGEQVPGAVSESNSTPVFGLKSAELLVPEELGTVIGSYRLIEQLGVGGMGVVYHAVQENPVRRDVALKIIKLGMDSRQIIARFEAERQALAMMDHPNIARVFDAGTTTSGRPYFAMELVKGVSITKYCSDNRLSLRQRLELFIPVCHAIHHAHQKGIIHRDIKPSNIIVATYDDRAIPKVIDFGIAKATQRVLTPDTVSTEVGQIVGSMEYMSPEQAELKPLDIDTRSDVYSLGVLIYELLTGSTPLSQAQSKKAGFVELLRVIREDDPPKPSVRINKTKDIDGTDSIFGRFEFAKYSGTLRGDLDWIVMKAIEKDRDRRYDSPLSLAADVRRFLNNEIVEATPPGKRYQIHRWMRKYGLIFATSIAFGLLMLVAVIVSTWQAIRATQAQNSAWNNEQLAIKNAKKALILAESERLAKAAESVQKEIAISRQREAISQRDAKEQALIAQIEAEKKSQKALEKSQSLSAKFALAQGQALAVNGDGGRMPDVDAGLLWMARAIRLAPSSDSETVRLARLQIARWMSKSISLISVIPEQDVSYACRILPLRGGTAFTLAGFSNAHLQVVDLETGKRELPPEGVRAQMGRALAANNLGTVMLVRRLDDSQALQFCDAVNLRPVAGSFRFKSPLATAVKGVFSPDGNTVWVTTRDGIQSARFPDGQALGPTIPTHGHVEALAITPDGHTLLAVEFGRGVLSFWDVSTGEESTPALSLDPGGTLDVAVSGDGHHFATCSGSSVRLGDLVTRSWTDRRFSLRSNCVSVSFAADGNAIAATGHDRLLYCWDVKSGKHIGTPLSHPRAVSHALFLADGNRFLTACEDRQVRFWSLNQEPVARRIRSSTAGLVPPPYFNGYSRNIDHYLSEMSLVVNQAKDEFLAAGRFSEVRCQRLSTGEVFGPGFDHGAIVVAVALSSDGRFLATGGADGQSKIWSRETGKIVGKPLYHPSTPVGLVFGPESQNILVGLGGTMLSGETLKATLWTLKEGVPRGWPVVYYNEGMTGSRVVDISSNGNHCLVAGLARADVFEIDTQKSVREPYFSGRWVRVGKFSPDGRKILFGTEDNIAQLWDVQTGEAASLPLYHDDWVESGCFSLNGDSLVTVERSGVIRLWDLVTSRQIGPSIHHPTRCVAIRFIDQNQLLVLDYNDALWRISLPGPITGTAAEITAQIELRTGKVLGAEGNVTLLRPDQLYSRKGMLRSNSDSHVKVPSPSNEVDTVARKRLWDYSNLLAAAYQESLHGQRGSAAALLAKTEDFSNAWECRLVLGLANRVLTTFQGHSQRVWFANYSQDETRVITGGVDGTAVVWDVQTGMPMHRLSRHSSDVTFGIFSPDDRTLVTCGGDQDRTAKLWDAKTGEELRTFQGHSRWIVSACFHPDGTRIATASGDGCTKLWDVASGRLLSTLTRLDSQAIGSQFSHDGQQLLVSYHDGAVILWATDLGIPVRTFHRHTNQVRSARFSQDGTKFVSASCDGTVKVWDVKTGEVLLNIQENDYEMWWADFHPDGKQIVTGSQYGTISIWDATTGLKVESFKGHSSTVHAVTFSRDGSRLLSAGQDGTVKIFNNHLSSATVELIGHSHAVTCASFSHDGSKIVTTSRDKSTRVWNSKTRECLLKVGGHESEVRGAAFSPDGKFIVSASEDRTARVWDTESGLAARTFSDHLGAVNSVEFSPVDSLVVSASDDQTARIWHLEKHHKPIALLGHTAPVRFAAFSPDGAHVVTCGDDRTVRMWNVADGTQLVKFQGHGGGVWRVGFNRAGTRLVTASADTTVRVWNALNGEELLVLEGHTSDVYGAAFSPDGSRIASVSLDGLLNIWDAATGLRLLSMTVPGGWATTVSFSPDGNGVVTGCSNRSACLWQIMPPVSAERMSSINYKNGEVFDSYAGAAPRKKQPFENGK